MTMDVRATGLKWFNSDGDDIFRDGYHYRRFPDGRNHTYIHILFKQWLKYSISHYLSKRPGMPSGPGALLALDFLN